MGEGGIWIKGDGGYMEHLFFTYNHIPEKVDTAAKCHLKSLYLLSVVAVKELVSMLNVDILF